jgi:hypothetical protein
MLVFVYPIPQFQKDHNENWINFVAGRLSGLCFERGRVRGSQQEVQVLPVGQGM